MPRSQEMSRRLSLVLERVRLERRRNEGALQVAAILCPPRHPGLNGAYGNLDFSDYVLSVPTGGTTHHALTTQRFRIAVLEPQGVVAVLAGLKRPDISRGFWLHSLYGEAACGSAAIDALVKLISSRLDPVAAGQSLRLAAARNIRVENAGRGPNEPGLSYYACTLAATALRLSAWIAKHGALPTRAELAGQRFAAADAGISDSSGIQLAERIVAEARLAPDTAAGVSSFGPSLSVTAGAEGVFGLDPTAEISAVIHDAPGLLREIHEMLPQYRLQRLLLEKPAAGGPEKMARPTADFRL